MWQFHREGVKSMYLCVKSLAGMSEWSPALVSPVIERFVGDTIRQGAPIERWEQDGHDAVAMAREVRTWHPD